MCILSLDDSSVLWPHERYTKVIQFLALCGTNVLRKVLLEYIAHSGQTTNSFLTSKNEIILRTAHEDLVPCFGKDKETDIKIWHICAITHVLITACTQLPTKVFECINRLRDIRNRLVYIKTEELSNAQYYENWYDIFDTLKAISIAMSDETLQTQLEEESLSIRSDCYEMDRQKYKTILVEWYQQDCQMVDMRDASLRGKLTSQIRLLYRIIRIRFYPLSNYKQRP